MRSEGYGMCLCVCVCVCVSVNISPLEHLRPENYITYSTANKNQKNCGFFSETASLALSPLYSHMYRQPFFMHMRYTYEHSLTGSYAHTAHTHIRIPAHTRIPTPRVCTLVLFIFSVQLYTLEAEVFLRWPMRVGMRSGVHKLNRI